jgi:hypothetical protein
VPNHPHLCESDVSQRVVGKPAIGLPILVNGKVQASVFIRSANRLGAICA